MSSRAQGPSRQVLAPPRGAAIAGVVFSVLMIASFGLVRYGMSADFQVTGNWLREPERRNAVRLALDLIPFAGIAFLWFIGVLRSRMGELEDQFFASVFLGSGLLFVSSLFGVGAVMRALIEPTSSETYQLGYRVSDALFSIFTIKMAGVFIFSTCTIGLRTEIIPRWVAVTGYASAVVLLLVIANWRWITFVFPLWMLLVSGYILFAESRSRYERAV